MNDRLKGPLPAFVRACFPRLPYLRLVPAVVLGQNADGTLELQPEDSFWPGLSHIPLRLGLPGAAAKVGRGGRVMVSFENSHPGKPVATSWDGGDVQALTLNAALLNLGGEGGEAVLLGESFLRTLGVLLRALETLASLPSPSAPDVDTYQKARLAYDAAVLKALSRRVRTT
jgi:hypothetical protein